MADVNKDIKKEEKYISLTEATKYCEYSQEYLSLRVRQGKLKGIKLGRNWVTKKEWLLEYIGSIETLENGNRKYKKEYIIKKEKSFAEKDYFQQAPVNLPVGQFSEEIQELFSPKETKQKSYNAKFLSLFFIACFLTFSSIFFLKEEIGNSAFQLSKLSKSFAKESSEKVLGKETVSLISFSFEKAKTFSAVIFASVKTTAKEEFFKKEYFAKASSTFYFSKNIAIKVFDATKESIYSLKQRAVLAFYQTYNSFADIAGVRNLQKKDLAKESKKQKEFLESVNEGMVVVPDNGENKEAVKKKIESSFSDEVIVQPEDDGSGVIIPVFKERKGEEYLYMMVPVKGKVQ